MTLFVDYTQPRRSRMEAPLDLSALPRIQAFIGAFASRNGWDGAMVERLHAVCEEALLVLLEHEEEQASRPLRHLLLAARKIERGAILEFVVGTREENIQDRLALLGDHPDEARVEREISLRMLRHLAASVHHQQYRGKDILTVRVEKVRAEVHAKSRCLTRPIQCAMERRRPSTGANPARQQSLQPVAIGAVEGGNDFD